MKSYLDRVEYYKKRYLEKKPFLNEQSRIYKLSHKLEASIYKKQYRLKNKEKIGVSSKQYCLKNKEKIKLYAQKHYLEKKAQIKIYNAKRYFEKKLHIKLINKIYQLNHKSQLLEIQRKYRLVNKKIVNEKATKYVSKRYNENSLVKLRILVATVMRSSLKRVNSAKGCASWESLLGFSRIDLKNHLEEQFSGGMSWDNFGSFWEIEHKIPLSWFKTREQLINRGWRLDNLQPLEKELNREKSNKYFGSPKTNYGVIALGGL